MLRFKFPLRYSARGELVDPITVSSNILALYNDKARVVVTAVLDGDTVEVASVPVTSVHRPGDNVVFDYSLQSLNSLVQTFADANNIADEDWVDRFNVFLDTSIAFDEELGSSSITPGHVTAEAIKNQLLKLELKLARIQEESFGVAPHEVDSVNVVLPITGTGSEDSPLTVAVGGIAAIHLARGSVVHEKLAEGSVGSLNIIDGAVENRHLGDGVVDSRALGPGAVTRDAISEGAVGTPSVEDGAIVRVKLSADIRRVLDGASGGQVGDIVRDLSLDTGSLELTVTKTENGVDSTETIDIATTNLVPVYRQTSESSTSISLSDGEKSEARQTGRALTTAPRNWRLAPPAPSEGLRTWMSFAILRFLPAGTVGDDVTFTSPFRVPGGEGGSGSGTSQVLNIRSDVTMTIGESENGAERGWKDLEGSSQDFGSITNEDRFTRYGYIEMYLRNDARHNNLTIAKYNNNVFPKKVAINDVEYELLEPSDSLSSSVGGRTRTHYSWNGDRIRKPDGTLVGNQNVFELIPAVGEQVDFNILEFHTTDPSNDRHLNWVSEVALTDKDIFTQEEREKLAGIEAGAQVNVQSDYDETDPSSPSFIRGTKPSGSTAPTYHLRSDLVITAAEQRVLGVGSGTYGWLSRQTPNSANFGTVVSGEDDLTRQGYFGIHWSNDSTGTSDLTIHKEGAATVSPQAITFGDKTYLLSDPTVRENGDFRRYVYTLSDIQDSDSDNNLATDGVTDLTTIFGTTGDIVCNILEQASDDNERGNSWVGERDLTDFDLYTEAERDKLEGIPADAEANVQSNWNQTDPSADDYIRGKPDVSPTHNTTGTVLQARKDVILTIGTQTVGGQTYVGYQRSDSGNINMGAISAPDQHFLENAGYEQVKWNNERLFLVKTSDVDTAPNAILLDDAVFVLINPTIRHELEGAVSYDFTNDNIILLSTSSGIPQPLTTNDDLRDEFGYANGVTTFNIAQNNVWVGTRDIDVNNIENVQADWLQENPSAPDFIRGRPKSSLTSGSLRYVSSVGALPTEADPDAVAFVRTNDGVYLYRNLPSEGPPPTGTHIFTTNGSGTAFKVYANFDSTAEDITGARVSTTSSIIRIDPKGSVWFLSNGTTCYFLIRADDGTWSAEATAAMGTSSSTALSNRWNPFGYNPETHELYVEHRINRNSRNMLKVDLTDYISSDFELPSTTPTTLIGGTGTTPYTTFSISNTTGVSIHSFVLDENNEAFVVLNDTRLTDFYAYQIIALNDTGTEFESNPPSGEQYNHRVLLNKSEIPNGGNSYSNFVFRNGTFYGSGDNLTADGPPFWSAYFGDGRQDVTLGEFDIFVYDDQGVAAGEVVLLEDKYNLPQPANWVRDVLNSSLPDDIRHNLESVPELLNKTTDLTYTSDIEYSEVSTNDTSARVKPLGTTRNLTDIAADFEAFVDPPSFQVARNIGSYLYLRLASGVHVTDIRLRYRPTGGDPNGTDDLVLDGNGFKSLGTRGTYTYFVYGRAAAEPGLFTPRRDGRVVVEKKDDTATVHTHYSGSLTALQIARAVNAPNLPDSAKINLQSLNGVGPSQDPYRAINNTLKPGTGVSFNNVPPERNTPGTITINAASNISTSHSFHLRAEPRQDIHTIPADSTIRCAKLHPDAWITMAKTSPAPGQNASRNLGNEHRPQFFETDVHQARNSTISYGPLDVDNSITGFDLTSDAHSPPATNFLDAVKGGRFAIETINRHIADTSSEVRDRVDSLFGNPEASFGGSIGYSTLEGTTFGHIGRGLPEWESHGYLQLRFTANTFYLTMLTAQADFPEAIVFKNLLIHVPDDLVFDSNTTQGISTLAIPANYEGPSGQGLELQDAYTGETITIQEHNGQPSWSQTLTGAILGDTHVNVNIQRGDGVWLYNSLNASEIACVAGHQLWGLQVENHAMAEKYLGDFRNLLSVATEEEQHGYSITNIDLARIDNDGRMMVVMNARRETSGTVRRFSRVGFIDMKDGAPVANASTTHSDVVIRNITEDAFGPETTDVITSICNLRDDVVLMLHKESNTHPIRATVARIEYRAGQNPGDRKTYSTTHTDIGTETRNRYTITLPDIHSHSDSIYDIKETTDGEVLVVYRGNDNATKSAIVSLQSNDNHEPIGLTVALLGTTSGSVRIGSTDHVGGVVHLTPERFAIVTQRNDNGRHVDFQEAHLQGDNQNNQFLGELTEFNSVLDVDLNNKAVDIEVGNLSISQGTIKNNVLVERDSRVDSNGNIHEVGGLIQVGATNLGDITHGVGVILKTDDRDRTTETISPSNDITAPFIEPSKLSGDFTYTLGPHISSDSVHASGFTIASTTGAMVLPPGHWMITASVKVAATDSSGDPILANMECSLSFEDGNDIIANSGISLRSISRTLDTAANKLKVLGAGEVTSLYSSDGSSSLKILLKAARGNFSPLQDVGLVIQGITFRAIRLAVLK